MTAPSTRLAASLTAAVCLAALAGCEAGAPDIPQGIDVSTGQGTFHGDLRGKTRAFLGIPYAAPPVGALRFRPPERPAPAGDRQVTRFGPTCPQFNATDGMYNESTSEDCLTLNVWTPDAPKRLLPVMVWF